MQEKEFAAPFLSALALFGKCDPAQPTPLSRRDDLREGACGEPDGEN
jgi:hypothetical protein